MRKGSRRVLGSFSSDSASELDVLGHNRDTLGMDGAEIGVLKQTDEVCLRRFLQSSDGRALESKISLEILCDFTNKSLEGQLADEQLGGFLVPTNFSQGNSTGPVTMRLLHSSGRRRALTSSLGGQLLPGGLSSGRFTGSLLCTSHVSRLMKVLR
jgi:hypothetical protein